MGEHLHELLHMAAVTLFLIAGASALFEYRVLRERVVLAFCAMCLCSAGYAGYEVICHNLPKRGAFWIPWTSAGLVMTFGATWFYLLAMQRFIGVRGRLFRGALIAQGAITAIAFGDLLLYAVARRSLMFASVPRPDVSAHQYELGEGAYSLLPLADVVAAVFMLSFLFGVGYLLVALIRTRSRDVLVYVGLIANSIIIANETLVAMSVYSGVYLLAFSKAFETVRIHHDIRTRAREGIERRLRQAEKLEAIGRVAGGIAHDFNNILMGIGCNVELAAHSVGQGHAGAENLRVASTGVDAGARIVRQLLDVARDRDREPEYVDVNEFLSDSAKFLSTLVGGRRKLDTTLEPALGGVMIDRGELTQVLMNLVINASDAMPEGGTIEIRATAASEALGGSSEGSPRPAVAISVIDQGRGIPPEVRDHVFEPFFTTKADQGGTGLGLATLQAIVRKAGGEVELESELGRGTCFRVILPRADPVEATRDHTPADFAGTSTEGNGRRKLAPR